MLCCAVLCCVVLHCIVLLSSELPGLIMTLVPGFRLYASHMAHQARAYPGISSMKPPGVQWFSRGSVLIHAKAIGQQWYGTQVEYVGGLGRPTSL